MNILIVGLGYAGKRFLSAFNYAKENNFKEMEMNIAYVSKKDKLNNLKFFEDVESALEQFRPSVVVVAVNDEFHAEILSQLKYFTGFVVCEKPLLTPKNELELVEKNLKYISGFCFDLIERYSDITITLKKFIKTNNLRLVRANFFWGKDRINDRRPTCGVTSEIIHALDLIQHVCDINKIKLEKVIGTRSDFSISGDGILDSIALTANFDDAAVTGYSSFVNITRKREIDFTFVSPENNLVYAAMIFDTPIWDIDSLHVWERKSFGDQSLIKMHTESDDSDPNLKTIRKLVRLVQDVIIHVANETKPSQPFANLHTAIALQKLLNSIEKEVNTIAPVKYVVGGSREFFNDESDLEKLG